MQWAHLFYLADWNSDASYDVILGCSWLRENKIGVFPHMTALAEFIQGNMVEWLWRSDKGTPGH